MNKYFSDDLKDLVKALAKYITKSPHGLYEVLDAVRDESIAAALRETGNNKAAAAKMLHIPRTNLMYHVNKLPKERVDRLNGRTS